MKKRLKRWGSLLLTLTMLLGNGTFMASATDEKPSTGGTQSNETGNTSNMVLKRNQVGATGSTAIALGNDGSVVIWGYNTKAQLADSDLNTSKKVARITGLDAIEVGITNNNCYALKKDGTVWYWGESLKRSGTYVTKPEEVPSLGGDVVDISCGPDYGLALKKDGTVCEFVKFRKNVIKNAKMICAGPSTRMVVLEDGTVWGWGGNYQRLILGNNTNTVDNPVKLDGIENVAEVSNSNSIVLVRKNDGSVWAWGNNSKGQLGNGTTIQSKVPIQINGLGKIKALSAGEDNALALTEEGELWSWGMFTYKPVGTPWNEAETKIQTKPLKIKGLDKVSSIYAGYCSFAVSQNGAVWGWGHDSNNILLNTHHFLSHPTLLFMPNEVGDSSYNVNPDTEIPPIKQLYTGENHTIALCEDGTLWAWGNNSEGQLGVGSNGDKSKPTQITGIGKVKSVEAGHNHTFIICEDGSIWTWGKNDHGQLGMGNTENQFKPVRLQ